MSDQNPTNDELGLSDEDLDVVAGGVAAEPGGKTTIIIIENP